MILLADLMMQISGGYGGSCWNCVLEYYDHPSSFICTCRKDDGGENLGISTNLGKLFHTLVEIIY